MQASKDLLSKIYIKAKEEGNIDDVFIDFLESIYPDKSSDVLQVIKRGITKYTFKPSNRIIWTAIGENDEYLIYPRIYCSCLDFYNGVVIKRKRTTCKHLISQCISEALKKFKEKQLDDSMFADFIEEIKLEP